MTFRLTSVVALTLLSALAAACVDTSEADDNAANDASADGANADGAGGSGGTQAPENLSCGKLVDTAPVVLGYLPTWTWQFDDLVQKLDYDTLTHVALAFANPDGSGTLGFGDLSDASVATLVDKAHAKDVKVLVSIAGAADSELVHGYITADKSDAYVASIGALVEKHGLDGVDVDIEGSFVDESYSPFVTKLAGELRPKGKLMTAAVARNSWDRIDDRAMWCFDFLNLMTYDYAGTWSDASEHSTYAQARSDLAYWAENRTYPAERSVLGMPFYGYCWGASCDHGYTPFSEIAANYPDQTGQDWITAGDRTISFNGTATITKKVQLAKDYGGVMIWELTQDTSDGQLWTALKAGL